MKKPPKRSIHRRARRERREKYLAKSKIQNTKKTLWRLPEMREIKNP
jgi:hypothetical protein